MIDQLLNSVMGLILGIFLAYFINTTRQLYKGPNSNIIKKQIYTRNDKCYKLEPVVHICPISKSML